MQWFRRHNRPVLLLLYLEWILLGIAVLTAFAPPNPPNFPPPPPPHFPEPPPPPLSDTFIPRPDDHPPPPPAPNRPPDIPVGRKNLVGVLASVGVLGILGLQLPVQSRSRLIPGLYTSLGFGLSWFAMLWGQNEPSFFSALLLVVVIRACVLFAWRGRILVAIVAYASFLFTLILGARPLEIPTTSLHSSPGTQSTVFDLLQSIVLSLALNSALLFGLVLVFVLLLVGALLAENQSRQELAKANQRLREYAILVEDQAILQERNRIAREIHDSVGHNLTAQSIQMENAAMFLATDLTQAKQYLQKARQLGAAALRDVRQSVAALRSHPLQGQSLEYALTKLIREFEQMTQIKLESHIYQIKSPSTEIAIALYRIIQEGLTNISKHSKATHVQLSLGEDPMGFHLKIEDNGCGFNPEQNTTGFGLQGMRERVSALGGKFKMSSQPSLGCTIQVDIPRPLKP